MSEDVRYVETNDADPWFRQNIGPLLWSRAVSVEVGGATLIRVVSRPEVARLNERESFEARGARGSYPIQELRL